MRMWRQLAALLLIGLAGCGSADPGTSPESGGQATSPSATPLRTLTLSDVRRSLKGWTTTIHSVPNSTQPTLACEAAALASLGADRSALREYDGSARSGHLINVHVATAVLAFEDSDEAATAFETVREWLATCPGAKRAKHPISGPGTVEHMQTKGGPLLLRTLTAAAPEVCSDCDAGWFDTQGVALVNGHRLVLTSVGWIGDLQAEVDPRGRRLVLRAATLAASTD